MTRALATMEQWLYAHSAKELAEVVASFFPRVSNEILVRSLQRYRDVGLWRAILLCHGKDLIDSDQVLCPGDR